MDCSNLVSDNVVRGYISKSVSKGNKPLTNYGLPNYYSLSLAVDCSIVSLFIMLN